MKLKPAPAPWAEPVYEKADVIAIQLVAQGKGEAIHQKRVIDIVVNKMAETYGLSFRPDSDGGERATSFAEGKRFVGSQLVKLMKANPSNYGTKETS